ncbi:MULTISPECIES: ATP-binding protein [Deinococcus]|uniref:histidine kinase n=1 Tax=Deinococcus rufus TaxID=2136097 RepID=A0ABV7ZBN2_9DEIO|nr:ATP-binding protein [Deinococcus sp. AB2017081]WQE97345.1 GAF domain-containing protein [Deinococcus sp. AB2017081]
MPVSGSGLSESPDIPEPSWMPLQEVTARLAGAHTREQVEDVVVQAASHLPAAPQVTVLRREGLQFRVAASTRDATATAALWTVASPQGISPLTDAVRDRRPRVYGHREALLAEYPQIETQTGEAVAAACAVVPVLLGSRVLGALILEYDQPHAFAVTELSFLYALASQAALTIDRLHLLRQAHTHEQQRDEATRRNQALEAFAVMSRDLASETDRYVLVRRAQEIMLSLLTPGYALYWEQAPDRWQLRSQVGDIGNPELQRLVDEHGLPLDAPALDSTWRTGVPNYQDDYAQGADTPAEMIRHVNAATAFQVRMYGQRIGMLAIGLFDQRVWTPMDKVLLETSVTSLGLALERAEQTRHVQERTAGLDAFVAFTEAVGSESDARRLAHLATHVLQAHLEDVRVAYYERQHDMWTAAVWSGNIRPDEAAQLQRGVPMDAPTFAEAVHSRVAVFSDGGTAGHGHPRAADPPGAAAVCPIFIDGDPQAILTVGRVEGATWTERQRAIVRAVGQSLGLALERAAQARALTAQRDALDRQTQELVAANEELEAFAYSASHDLRTPVRHVMGFADLARIALANGDTEKVLRNLGIVQQGARRMEQLIDGMLMLSRAGRQDFRPHWVPLAPLIAQAQQDAQLEFPAQPITLHGPPPVAVWGDPTLIQQVLTNLISNAVKYSTLQAVSEVVVQVREEPAEWVITVRDNGVGFDPRYAARLFGIFQRLHPQGAYPGIGAGLATVRRIVVKHGGRVFADSADGQGATFGFTLAKPAR